jgi:hypothetical protein
MLIAALVIVALFALPPASASADGLPAVGVDANPVSNPGAQVEYQTTRSQRWPITASESPLFQAAIPRSNTLILPRSSTGRVYAS